MFAFIFHGSRSQTTHQDSQLAAQSRDQGDVFGRRAISMESTPIIDSPEPSRFLSLERTFSTNSLTKGFLSQFRAGSRNNSLQTGDELGYLEGKSSVEGPPSQRIYARILWKVPMLNADISIC